MKKQRETDTPDHLHGMERHIRIRDAAAMTGLSEAFYRSLVMRRKIKHVKVGTATLIPVSEIRRLIEDGQREPIGAA